MVQKKITKYIFGVKHHKITNGEKNNLGDFMVQNTKNKIWCEAPQNNKRWKKKLIKIKTSFFEDINEIKI